MDAATNLVEVILYRSPFYIVTVFLICILLGLFAVSKKILDRRGAIGASIIGGVIAITADFVWLILLILFLALNHFVTITKYSYKEQMGLAEGKRGMRSLDNVLANGLIPSVIAFSAVYLEEGVAPVLYLTAICAVSADTFASEIGVLSKKVYLITTFKKVKPGVDGGVSGLGEVSSMVGSVISAFFGFFLIGHLSSYFSSSFLSFPLKPLYLFLPFAAGVLSCQLDSILGATLQRWGYLSNSGVNFLSVIITTMGVWALFVFDIV
ncbi:MAG: DUF92 domain-containing protein [Candidatus Thermoplasmatota archaeon]|jgi:uncharacterized protein (TIGR00297 family)|nr:DUF92 domain-containing protein [Candidatus Thermoplasmatota archaeon]MDP7265370.1 DUF92 domain-containing protein [Candidatus Thermoplasmatota archaeon]